MVARGQSGRAMVLLRMGSSALGSASQAALLLLLARDLGPTGFAPFGQLMSLAYLLGLAASFGFGVQALRLGSSFEARRTLGSMVLVRGATSTLIVVVLAVLLARFWPGQSWLFAAAALLMFNELCADLVLSGLSGQGRQNLGSLVILLQRGAGSLLPVLLVMAGAQWSEAIAGGQILVTVLFVLVAVQMCGLPCRVVDAIRDGLPFWLSTLVPGLGQLDVTIAYGVGGPQASGMVAAGARFNGPLTILPQAILTVFVPRLSRLDDVVTDGAQSRRHREVARLLRVVTLYALALSLLSPVAGWALLLVLGPAYADGYWFFTALVIAAALNAVSQVLQGWLYALGRPGAVTRVVFLGVAGGLAGLASGLFLWGLTGAAVGPVLCQVIILVQYARLFVRDGNQVDRRVPARHEASPSGQ